MRSLAPAVPAERAIPVLPGRLAIRATILTALLLGAAAREEVKRFLGR